MGKLQDALRRVKEAGAAERPGRRQTQSGSTPAYAADGASSLWPSMVRYECDPVAMETHRVISGVGHAAGATMAYNMLRTRLIKRMRENKWSSLVVTSPNAGAGKSITALNLATSIAREHNQRVYLVDADFRVPSLHTYLGITPAVQLTDYLDGKVQLDQLIAGIGVERLFMVFNTVQHEHSAELLTSPRMKQFIQELRDRDPNGLIIYDAPPLLAADDVLAFSPLVDAVLMVVAEGETDREDLAKSVQVLGDANVLGVVLNKSRDVSSDSYY